jgi:NADH-quinone oxidoreductase subunit G
MEGYQGLPPPSLIPRFWSPGWNSVQALNKFQSEVGGPLRGGDPGARLVEPTQVDKVSYFHDIPSAFQPRKDEWLIVPIHHIFGSEELSILSPGVSELAPRPYVAMSPDDAMYLECEEGQEVRLNLADMVLFLAVKLTPIRKGAVGVPVGLPELLGVSFPQWGRISRRM